MVDLDTTFVGVREVRREREIYDEVGEVLRITAPQALLRDLHRPVDDFRVSIESFEQHEIPRDGGRDAYATAKGWFRERYSVPIVELLRTNRAAHEAMAELRELLRRPWADAPKLGVQVIPASLAML